MPYEGSDFLSLISRPVGASRIELSRKTGISPSKVGKLIRDLVDADVLSEEELVETSRGRKPVLVRPSKCLGNILAVDIGMSNFRALVTDMQGDVICAREVESPSALPIDEALERILSFTDSLLVKANVAPSSLLAVGISHSGGFDPETGECLYWHSAMHWKGVALARIFSERYGVPAKVDDSANCMALAEMAFGEAIDFENFVLINIGAGVGCGLFLNGQLFRGASGNAGELGHWAVVPNGPRCACGNYGCLEVKSSGNAIIKAASEILQENVTTSLREIIEAKGEDEPTLASIAEAIRLGDRVARRIIREAAHPVGATIGNLLNFLNPPLVVLTGGVMSAVGDLMTEVIQREASANSFEVAFQRTRIVRSKLDSMAAARGAALMTSRNIMYEVCRKRAKAATMHFG